jgi:DNA-binding response OmpR family regulator
MDIWRRRAAGATVAAMPAALLLAETEPESRGFLERHLADDGFAVVPAGGAAEALALAERARPDLLLLGHPLPDGSAVEVCHRLREGEPGRSWDRDVAVIVLAGEDADAVDRVRALERGCDDVVARPYMYEELLARIRAVLRRTSVRERERIDVGGLVVDRGTRRVTVGGEAVPLAGKEFELLLKLASDPTRVFAKERLLREVWGFRSLVPTRTVDSHASRLRRKLAREGFPPYVVNVWGVGYKLLDG